MNSTKKLLLCSSLFILLVGTTQAKVAENYDNNNQPPLSVAIQFLEENLPRGNSESRFAKTTIEQTRVSCPDNTPDCQYRSQIIFTDEGLDDDSVYAIRKILLLEKQQNRPWQIIQQSTQYQCTKGRGKQFFQKNRCL